jgi:hypothetical protein
VLKEKEGVIHPPVRLIYPAAASSLALLSIPSSLSSISDNFSIIFLFAELKWIISPIEQTADAKSYLELSKQFKGKKWDEFSDEYKTQVNRKKNKGVLSLF